MAKLDRYIDNDVLVALSRPQYDWSCSLTSLTGAINYLWPKEPTSQDEVANTLNLDADEIGSGGGPGNDTVISWFNEFTRKRKLKGKCKIWIDGEDVEDISQNESLFKKIKEAILLRNQVLMFHKYNHYNIICGYFESALSPSEAYAENPKSVQRWLVQAEHNPDQPPIIPIRWRAVRHQLMKHERYCLILCERFGA